jgi:triacylglycerol esterase/lipase EstA (alpha/beta hydrolase family)
MLSDTARFVDSKGNDAGYDFSPVDINLKEIALDLLINEIAVPGLSASSRELIAIEKVTAPQVMQELLASKEARKKVVTALKEMINASNPSEEQAALLQAKLMSAKAEVAKASHVYTSLIGDQLLKAPMAISQFSMETASGHLLRDNLNLIEDQISAVTQIAEESQGIIEAEMKKPEKERNLTLIKI